MKRTYVSAEDIDALFYREARRRRLPSWQLVSAAFLIVVGVFLLINAPSAGQQVGYWWETDIQAPTRPISSTAPQLPVIAEQTAPKTFDPANIVNNSLYIPKTKTTAPIIWDVSAGGELNEDLLKALQNGVARYPKTALPDQVGNVFLTGHSSNYWWDKGHYKTVFVLLNRLVVGDRVYIKYQNQLYVYRVSGQKVVSPNETSVLAPTSTPTLSLMTCTPTGTTLLRRIVTADLISPNIGLKSQPTVPDAASINAIR